MQQYAVYIYLLQDHHFLMDFTYYSSQTRRDSKYFLTDFTYCIFQNNF
jgi:hypothetical protein